jgi:hypothetical protein
MLQNKLQIALALVMGRSSREPVYDILGRSSTDLGSEDGLLKTELDNDYPSLENNPSHETEGSRRSHQPYLLTWINVLLFVVSTSLFAFTILAKSSSPNPVERNHYLKMTSEQCNYVHTST